MSISEEELNTFTVDLNEKLKKYGISIVLSKHFSIDRINDSRNIPKIQLKELYSIFEKLLRKHKENLIKLDNQQQFTIKCLDSHINIPCIIVKEYCEIKKIKENSIITKTIMRKKDFIQKKQDIIFEI